MDKLELDLMTALSDRKGYGFIANHYTQFSMEQLRDIALELLYELQTAQERECTPSVVTVAEELEYIWS